jgi:hypothetical protein
MRKPFDLLAKGLNLKDSRGDRIRTYDPLVPKLPFFKLSHRCFACKFIGKTAVCDYRICVCNHCKQKRKLQGFSVGTEIKNGRLPGCVFDLELTVPLGQELINNVLGVVQQLQRRMLSVIRYCNPLSIGSSFAIGFVLLRSKCSRFVGRPYR